MNPDAHRYLTEANKVNEGQRPISASVAFSKSFVIFVVKKIRVYLRNPRSKGFDKSEDEDDLGVTANPLFPSNSGRIREQLPCLR